MNKYENFITAEEAVEIRLIVEKLSQKECLINNKHLESVANSLNGEQFMFDISKSTESNILSTYQSSNNLMTQNPPDIFIKVLDRIANKLNISKQNVFLQVLRQEAGGSILAHYDSAIDGFITYKCNVSIQSEDYQLFLEDQSFIISELDLYCFEASLYKHRTGAFKKSRIILSYGFILAYEELGRDHNCPRVRLSKRIIKYFQNK
jgi:hypothetical protein